MTVKQVSGLCLRETGRRFIVSLKASNRYSASYLESLERTTALADIFRKSAAGRRYGCQGRRLAGVIASELLKLLFGEAVMRRAETLKLVVTQALPHRLRRLNPPERPTPPAAPAAP